MNLDRPMVFLDLESTGVNPALDRIVSVGLVVLFPSGETVPHYWLCNPGRPIPAESSLIHRITDEMVRDRPRFASIAREVHEILDGRDIAGFGLMSFDMPLLWGEFHEAGITWDLTGVRIVDVGLIFKLKEPRDLQAAFKRYSQRRGFAGEWHNAIADAIATHLVFEGQLVHYPDLAAMTLDQLAAFSQGENRRIDFAGKLVRDAEGEACYAFGRNKGVKVKADLAYADWMLGVDFCEETKFRLRKVLAEIERRHAIREAAQDIFPPDAESMIGEIQF